MTAAGVARGERSPGYQERLTDSREAIYLERVELATLTPPRNSSVGYNAQTGTKIIKQCRRQPLGHDVGELLSSRDVEHANVSDGDLLANKVDVQLDVLHAAMVHRVLGEVDGRNIVAVDDRRRVHRNVKFSKKMA